MNYSDDKTLIAMMEAYLREGRGSTLEQTMFDAAIVSIKKHKNYNKSAVSTDELIIQLQDQVIALKEELLDTLEAAGVLHERIERLERVDINSPMTLSIENINKICREDEQIQLKNLTDPSTCFKLGLKEEAEFNNEQLKQESKYKDE
jgi:hypothetical protein